MTLFNTRRLIDRSYLVGGIHTDKSKLNNSLSHSKNNSKVTTKVIFLLSLLNHSFPHGHALAASSCWLPVFLSRFLAIASSYYLRTKTPTSIYSLSSHHACDSTRADFQKLAYTASIGQRHVADYFVISSDCNRVFVLFI